MVLRRLALLLALVCAAHRFVALHASTMDVKSTDQVSIFLKQYESNFDCRVKDALATFCPYDVYMLMDGPNLVAFALAKITASFERPWGGLFSFLSPRSVPFISFYAVFVADDYRGRGICGNFMKQIVAHLERKYALPAHTMLTLHLSPTDVCMPIAAHTYYKLGFTRGTYTPYCPNDFQYAIGNFIDSSHDIYAIADNPSLSRTQGAYLAMYCRLSEFAKSQKLPHDSLAKGKALQAILAERRAGHKESSELGQ